jgi:peroxiredoxin Q/BCP
LNAQVLGISHNSTDSQARFAAKLGLHYPLLSDPPGDVAKVFGAKSLLPFFSRKTYVIDGKGILRLVMDGQPDMEKLLAFLEGLHGDLGEA